MKSFEEFEGLVYKKLANEKPNNWREGQYIFNIMPLSISQAVLQHNNKVDCYYTDSNIDQFLRECYEYIKAISKPSNKIIMMQGPPACGKTTTAQKLAEEDPSNIIISRRDVQVAHCTKDPRELADEEELRSVEFAVALGLTPIIDSTNLDKDTICKWKAFAEANGLELEIQECVVSFKEACSRDDSRVYFKVGREVIEKIFREYYPELIDCEVEHRKMKEFDPDKPKCIIVDIDGTLALRHNRSPFEYDKVESDVEDFRVVELIREMLAKCSYEVIFLTGREDSEESRSKTTQWLQKRFDGDWNLYMRKNGDRRGDDIVKKEIYKSKIEPYFNVAAVFEDRNKVVDMWRSLGLLCLQVYPGDF